MSTSCEAEVWSFTYEVGGETYVKAQQVVEEVIYIGTFFITQAMIRLSNNLSQNKQKGLNALKCAFQSGFINVYFLIEAAYYAARQFGQDQMLVDLANEYYPMLCTCVEDVDKIGEFLGSDSSTQENFAKCGETDYDQCWFPVLQDDSSYACDNCEKYWLATDDSECFSCEVAVETDDGAGNITYSCHGDCTDFSLNTDVCEYDCTAIESETVTADDGTTSTVYSCYCDGYENNGSDTAC